MIELPIVVDMTVDEDSEYNMEVDSAFEINIGGVWGQIAGNIDNQTDLIEKFDEVESSIPTKTSELTNDSGYLTSVPVTSVNNKTGAVNLSASDVGALPASTTYVSSVNGQSGAVTGLQTTSNLVTSVSSSSTDSQYPSAKCLYDMVGDIETLLASI